MKSAQDIAKKMVADLEFVQKVDLEEYFTERLIAFANERVEAAAQRVRKEILKLKDS